MNTESTTLGSEAPAPSDTPASSSNPPSTTNNPTAKATATIGAGATTTKKVSIGMMDPTMEGEPAASAVLTFLRKRGLSGAVLELQHHLKDTTTTATSSVSNSTTATNTTTANISSSATAGATDQSTNEQKEQQQQHSEQKDDKTSEQKWEDAIREDMSGYDYAYNQAKYQRTSFVRATGGGFGYEIDAAPSLLLWGNSTFISNDTKSDIDDTTSTAGKNNNSKDGMTTISTEKDKKEGKDDTTSTIEVKEPETKKIRILQDSTSSTTKLKQDKKHLRDVEPNDENWEQQDEAKRFVHGFTTIQMWVLSLPDDDLTQIHHQIFNNGGVDDIHSSDAMIQEQLKRNQQVFKSVREHAASSGDISKENDTKEQQPSSNEEQITTAADSSAKPTPNVIPDSGHPTTHTTTATTTTTSINAINAKFLPPTCKPELLSITFILLVHTYCELLECGLEYTAASLLSTYKHVHESLYPTEFLDLEKCCTTRDIVLLKENVRASAEVYARAQIMKIKLRDLKKQMALTKSSGGNSGAASVASSITDDASMLASQKIQLENQYDGLLVKFMELKKKLNIFPFLKRVRTMRWHLNISSVTYGYLVRFLHGDNSLLPMSALLQSRCYVVVENREPSSYTPACVLEDMVQSKDDDGNGKGGDKNKKDETTSTSSTDDVRWATPLPQKHRICENGGDVDLSSQSSSYPSILRQAEHLPFPKFNVDTEYETEESYENDKKRVEFNRALLVNGFRRLEAIEVKSDYESGTHMIQQQHQEQQQRPVPIESSEGGVSSSSSSNNTNMRVGGGCADPTKPTILLSTLCDSTTMNPSGGTLQESTIDITSAKVSPPDGRRVAAGCTDSAIRIWSVDSLTANSNNGSNSKGVVDSITGSFAIDTPMVLLGHKQGLPVYDVDWNRDGRFMISAGGDGAVRLWDTNAVGPIGEVMNDMKRKPIKSAASKKKNQVVQTYSTPTPFVNGAKDEPMVKKGGAALAYYMGHAASTPVWSVAMAPCGYYFASAGADKTARLYCTDRPTPIRIFAGHFSPNVNCITWHPNCNYVLSGSDDRTVRMWDIQTGRSVRLLSGCAAGVNQVRVSPSGQYVAGSDYRGMVHIWDVRNGRKVNELCHPNSSSASTTAAEVNGLGRNSSMIHTMSYSACGTTIATGGDDCMVNVWDARGLGNVSSNPEYAASTGWGSQSNNRSYGATENPYTKKPINSFRTNQSMILDLKYTKRNLLLSVGKFVGKPVVPQ